MSGAVCAWLSEMELGEYASIFRENKIDGEMLLGLSEKDLEDDFGMSNKYHRRRFLSKRSICALSVAGGLPTQPLSAASAATTASAPNSSSAASSALQLANAV
jgi:hypothetical protein